MIKINPSTLYGSLIDIIGCVPIVELVCRACVRVKGVSLYYLLHANRRNPSVYQGVQGIICPLNRGGGGLGALLPIFQNRFS